MSEKIVGVYISYKGSQGWTKRVSYISSEIYSQRKTHCLDDDDGSYCGKYVLKGKTVTQPSEDLNWLQKQCW